ncbi:hypothetical protein N806_24225 [Rhodococcus sp. P27]|nr:hypothetical protein N806_24225 [Rhodococcus sp. P27]
MTIRECRAERECLTGNGIDSGDARSVAEVALKLEYVLREAVRRTRVASQSLHRLLITTGRAAETEIDSTGVQSLEGAELLGDRQRCVVGQHDSTGAEADFAGVRGDVADQNAGCRRRDGTHVVVLGVPDSLVAPLLGTLRQGHAGVEAVFGGFVVPDVGEVEDGKWYGHGGGAFLSE